MSTTSTTKPRKPRTRKVPVPVIDFPTDLTLDEVLKGLVAVHVENGRTLQRVKGGTGSREARCRLRLTGEILAGLGASPEQIRLAL